LCAARPELIALGKGGAQPNISQTILKGHSLLLPPRDEQRRMVATLTSLFERLKTAREALTHVPQLIERYRRAILDTELFGNFATGHNSSPCEQKSLEELCDKDRGITYGVIKLGTEEPNGVRCLRTSNVRWLEIDTDGMKRINLRLSREYGRTILKGGEVLVNVRGTLGGVAVVPTEMVGWNVSREVAVVPINPSIANPHYVAYSIASDNSQQWLRGVQKGVAYTGINLSDLRRLQVNLPSIEAQEEIVRRVRASHANAMAILAEAKRSESLFDRLEQATLTKAFRGELVFHDPNDSPVHIQDKSLDVARNRSHPAMVRSLTRRKKLIGGTTMAKKRAEVSKNHLADTLQALGGKADAKKLWQRSEMDIDEFYKQLRNEITAGYIKEDASKERLKLANAS
jgi:type I restriction enzyme S subunit